MTRRASTVADSVQVLIPGPLRGTCGGAEVLAISAATVREALGRLEQQFPALYRSICDDTGTVRRHINVFVNTQHMRDRQGLETPLVAGDEVIILPAVSGG